MIGAVELKKTFEGKRVLVTGHTGFKGSWLTYMLHNLGAEVAGYSLSEPENPRHSYYALGLKNFLLNPDNCLHDIRSMQDLQQVIGEYKPDYIFHLAAQAIVSTSYKAPYETVTTNIIGTVNILEILRKMERPITSVIITSDKCYKNKERMEPYKEDEEMGGDDPYSASKGACELIFHSYMFSYFKDAADKHIASVRAGNVFGGGDWSANRLVPDCIRNLLTKGVVDIRMPEAVRPWTFVIEILYGYLTLAAKLGTDKKYEGSWNFASGETRTVLQVCETLIDALKEGKANIDKNQSVGKESGLLLVDETKARSELGWDLVYGVDDALRFTAEWYYSQHKGVDMAKYSSEFLAQYFARTEVLE